MPYPLSRPIPVSNSNGRDRGDHFFTGTAGSGPRSVSPSRNVRPRRRSSTIKNALFSILGTSSTSPSFSHPTSSSLPKNYSSLSIGGGVMTDRNGKVRRNSTASSDRAFLMTPPRKSFNDFVPSSALNGPTTEDDEEEEYGLTSHQGEGSFEESTVGGTSTTASSMSNRSGGSTSLKSFGREFLNEYLTERGLLSSKVISETSDLRISVAASGDHVFLPTMSSNDDEYLARLNGLRSGEEEAVEVEPEFFSQDRTSNDGGLISNDRDSGSSFSDSISSDDETAITDGDGDGDESLGSVAEESSRSNNADNTDSCRRKNSTVSTTTTAPMFEIDNSMATYTLAVVLTLHKPTSFSSIKAELCSRARVYWHSGVPPTKTFYEEFYCAGSLEWEFTPENANLFVPLNVSSEEKIIENNRNVRDMRLFKNKPNEARLYLDKNETRSELLKKVDFRKSLMFQAGDYVFIVPIAFSNHIPESLYFPSARVNYRFRIATRVADVDREQSPTETSQDDSRNAIKAVESDQINHKRFSNSLLKKIRNNLHLTNQDTIKDRDHDDQIYAEYPLDIIRTPPQVSISTANKPVYINRVWANSLSYEISFAQKYVSLDSEVPVKIKLAPMSKNICLKRLRISVIEKITFVSKNYEYEYDQIDPVAKDPYNPYFSDFASKRRKERNISLLEVRTTEKGSRAIREEIVQNSLNDNLLAYSSTESDSGQPNIGITEPLLIETSLKFPKYEDLNKKTARTVPPYGIDVYTSVPNPETAVNATQGHRSGVRGFLASRKNSLTTQAKTNNDTGQQPSLNRSASDQKFHETKIKSNAGIPVQFHTKLNETRRGLYLDSLHFSNIYSKHKLEFMLRISKPDDRDPKRLRHYEVLIDTPIFLVSELCNSGNMELPTYDMAITTQSLGEADMEAAPPTFEEAISVPGSPIQSPIISPFGSPGIRANYDPDDLSINQLSLSRTNSIASPSGTEGSSLAPTQMSLSHSVDANHRYNNLDRLLSASPGVNGEDMNSTEGKKTASENQDEAGYSVTFQEPTYGPSVFKKGYTISPNTVRKGGGSRTSSDEELRASDPAASLPPSYDEVVPLMSDDE